MQDVIIDLVGVGDGRSPSLRGVWEIAPHLASVSNVVHIMLRPLRSSDVGLNLFKTSKPFQVLLT